MDGESGVFFQGYSPLSLDAKGRLAIPARYRERLRDCCAARLVITINPQERCLWVYPRNEWLVIAGQLARLPTLNRQNQTMKRLLLGRASEVEMDAQGRVLLSAELREYANLDKRVVLSGDGRKFELWDEARYNELFNGWLEEVAEPGSDLSEGLEQLAL